MKNTLDHRSNQWSKNSEHLLHVRTRADSLDAGYSENRSVHDDDVGEVPVEVIVRTPAVSIAIMMMLTTVGCTSTTEKQAGPVEVGSTEAVPDRSVCVAEVPLQGTVWFGERATNRSDRDATITSIEAIDAEGMEIKSIKGRVMSASDPHFLAFSEESRGDPAFSGVLENLEAIDGQVLRSGDALGIVVEAGLRADSASVGNIKVTYEYEDATYSSVTATTLMISSSACPE